MKQSLLFEIASLPPVARNDTENDFLTIYIIKTRGVKGEVSQGEDSDWGGPRRL